MALVLRWVWWTREGRRTRTRRHGGEVGAVEPQGTLFQQNHSLLQPLDDTGTYPIARAPLFINQP